MLIVCLFVTLSGAADQIDPSQQASTNKPYAPTLYSPHCCFLFNYSLVTISARQESRQKQSSAYTTKTRELLNMRSARQGRKQRELLNKSSRNLCTTAMQR
jgi:hypothetical protein